MADPNEPKLGINSWLQDELYQTYLHDNKTVDESWKKIFESNGSNRATGTTVTSVSTPGIPTNGDVRAAVQAPAAKSLPATPRAPEVPLNADDQLQPMRGVSGKIAENMTTSLTVPTATSQRILSVRALEQHRAAINKQREAAGLGKLSFTHFISWAIVKALGEFPQLNHAYTEHNGEPTRVVRNTINFGLAVDVKAKDGSSTLMVPNIKNAGALSFQDFLAAFDDVVARARAGKLQMPDFQGTTISLTNPGTVGTASSVPRLMVGQGAIIATGAMDYPPGYDAVPEAKKQELGVSKVMGVTCTYDHRIIQGAESGRFLGKLAALLGGESNFYEDIYRQLGLAFQPPPAVAAAPVKAAAAPVATPDFQEALIKEGAAIRLIGAYRRRGHLVADLDPLGSKRPTPSDLQLSTYGLTEADLDRPVASEENRPLRDVIEDLKRIYCGKCAYEYTYIINAEEREWLRARIEDTTAEPLSNERKLHILDELIKAEEFEHFLHTRFLGKKRFSSEGGESVIVALDEILARAADAGVIEAVMGMAHRGRLTILANVIGKPLHQVFSEFEEAPDATANAYGSGDVKYHLGASGQRTSPRGNEITVSVAFNPSHLEAVDPVVEGMARPKQDRLGNRSKVLPILIHGDAAFIGQGVVAETLNMSQLEGYSTGGTIHIIINNQVGFTTPPEEGRSGPYSSDIAKIIQSPVFHVNSDDPEAVLQVAQLAFDYRREFKRDVVIDLVCYRRHGHNEGDDPSYTQPQMYKTIKGHPSVIAQYSQKLVKNGVITDADVSSRKKGFVAKLVEGYDLAKKNAEAYELQEEKETPAPPSPAVTGISGETAEQVLTAITTVPSDFQIHPKLKKIVLDSRLEALTGAPIDYGTAEALAFGSLLVEGFGVRLSGQDSGRGTFSHRHSELYDYATGKKVTPLKSLESNGARFEVYDSPLSEYAVMGFEFGFSVSEPNTLVLWEAQFGDFVNGAQIILDQFLSSAETKWGTSSGLVLLLPHGYEGMGPEHSSARIERFLQLCAENNMQVANCSTPAQYFHLLRRQMKGGMDGKPLRKPLVIFTPKSILRHPRAVSTLDEVINGGFQEVLPDVSGTPA
ncbi:MAG TPA: multifunctional oxoglutarate decarboxylase/oxoglutarate dehydrogenase thiamine pyrophosphate-binding subunit/dihydrolipoyllysine-residue succinyltransferase subunit, partial [Bryobacteraceae bacterium]|nr:multifunctional oxoglutarate decarboxylase/oxoglutarate dehydrogenase thiamine pyrophosphate-binding subunit/dihydrolipoyllysine-residue succinyltransferase subunit [Bryobacteraceae bacterium]